jgi:tetratricopeptide (TPR) repeat protein
MLLTEMGELTKADEVAEALRDTLELKEQSMDTYHHAAGWIALARGNPEAAIAHLTEIPSEALYYNRRFALARAYQEAEHLAEAAAEYERLLNNYSNSRAFWCDWDVKARYYLGRVYEESRWSSKAIDQYEAFLEFWQHADAGIPEIAEARERLKRLQAGS